MTDNSINFVAPHSGLRNRLDAFFAGLGQGFNAYLESASRMREIEALNAKSNEQLQAMGLAREDIPRHVFRDLLAF